MTPLLTGVFASQISGHLNTFTPSSSYDSLATYTVPSGGISSITFSVSGITNYSHLQIRYIARDVSSTNDGNSAVLRFNLDSGSNYVRHYLLGDGSSTPAGSVQNLTGIDGGLIQGGGGTATCYSAGVIDILDYNSSTKYKTVRSLSGNNTNSSSAVNYVEFESGLWLNTSAINSIDISCNGGNLAQYSQFSIYGVR